MWIKIKCVFKNKNKFMCNIINYSRKILQKFFGYIKRLFVGFFWDMETGYSIG